MNKYTIKIIKPHRTFFLFLFYFLFSVLSETKPQSNERELD